MANTTFNVPRAHLTMALCLPLAVLLGYVMAEPLESGSLAVVVFVLVILSVPLFMKWHHPLLILGWNAAINPVFLPGRAALWLLLSAISLFFAVINRATNPDHRFISVPTITRPLLFLTAVVAVTGFLNGGFGARLFGSSQYGGGRYIYLLGAIAGYFSLTTQRIPLARGPFYGGLFFLSGLTAIIANLAYLAGPGFYFIYYFFSPGYAQEQAMASVSLNPEMVRIGSLSIISPALYSWIFARYGIGGVLDLSKPWRLLLLIAAIVAGMFGGFRSGFILFLVTFFFMFFLEGLHRTRYLFAAAAVTLLTTVLLIGFGSKLPIQVQRTLTILPIKLDPLARESAKISSEWRTQMWRVAMDDVPKHIFRGKGYALDPRDVGETQFLRGSIHNESWAGALLMGDYHNGPLSVVIPFGIYGVGAFLWFIFASLRLMWRYLVSGHTELRRINALLLATFAAKSLLFLFVFGAIHTDMAFFTGLIGLSVALNGAPEPAAREELDPAAELDSELNHGLSASS